MSYRTVILKDGSMMKGEIPDDISDDQVREDAERNLGIKGTVKADASTTETKELKKVEESLSVPEQGKEEESYLQQVGTDLKRSAANIGLAIPNLASDIVSGIGSSLGYDPIDEEKQAKLFSQATSSLLGAFGLSDEGVMDKETGRVQASETLPGIAADIGTYIIGGSRLAAKIPEVVPKVYRYGLGALGAEQLLSDPVEGNIANVIKNVAPSIEGKSAVIEYLASEEDDNELLKRAKMSIASGGVGLLLQGGFKASQLTLRAGAMFKKKITDLTKAEEDELVESFLKEARQGAKSEDIVNAQKAFQETDEGLAQVIAQSDPVFVDKNTPLNLGAFFKRVQQQVFTSRGYFTPSGFNASRESITKQRQLVSEASHISNRLNIAVGRIEDSAVEAPKVLLRSQKALTENLDFIKDIEPVERIAAVASKYNIPEDVAEEVVNARVLIDELSTSVLGTKAANKKTKEAIQANLGSYLNRSYRLFEDEGFSPSDKVRQDAINFLAKEKMASNKAYRGSPKKEEKAFRFATSQVNRILGETKTLDETYNYFAKSRYVNKNILKYKDEVPQPVRDLMGEITDPSENILLTIGKLGKLSEESKFYDRMYEMGAKGRTKYIFKPGQDYDQSRFNAVISGTNTQLDGMVTTPQMLKAIQGAEDTFNISNTGLGRIYKGFLGFKGLSQKSKTVYSHQAQIRNFLGGSQFGLANGWVPVAGKKGSNSYASLKNQIGMKGDKEFDAHYEKLQGMGVINTSVKAGEFRALMSRSDDIETGVEGVSKALEKIGVSKKTQQLPEDVYMAVDDYFKINNYARELNVLKEAFPDQAIEVLERKAAKTIQNTMPNYDFVPKGIRILRELPVGNFVSFPSEIIRTSVNIAKQASDEIAIGLKENNDVMLKRGSSRLAGMIGVNASWSALSAGAYQGAGLLYEEYKAFNTLMERDYSKNHNKIVYRTDDGKLYANDPTFIDSYATIRDPIMAASQRIQEGELKGEQLDAYLASAAFKGAQSLLSTYVDPAILSETGAEILEAVRDPQGRTSKGQLLFAPDAPVEEKIGLGVAHLFQAFLPGSVTNAKQLVDAAFETPNRRGQTRTFEADLLANMSGVRFTEFDPKAEIENSAKRYMADAEYNLSNINPDYITSGDRLEELYERRQKYKLSVSKELYRKVQSAQYFMSDAEIMQSLIDSNLTKDEAGSIMYGFFVPDKPSEKFSFDVYSKTPFKSSDSSKNWNDTVRNMVRMYSDFSQVRLMAPAEEEDDNDDDERQGRAKGGEVLDVPNAPSEPDQRIDKMTGMPYDQQAGTAFTDQEDRQDPLQRMGFGSGGSVQDPLQRMGFMGGGIAKLVKLGLKAADEVVEELPMKNTDELIEESKQIAKAVDAGESDAALKANSASKTTQKKQMSGKDYEERWSSFEDIEDVDAWQDAVKKHVKENRDVDPVVRTPELEQSAKDLIDKKTIDRSQHLQNVQRYKPITTWGSIPKEPSTKSLVYSLKPNQMEKGNFVVDDIEAQKFNVTKSFLSIGDFFNGRLDIPAYKDFDTWIVAGTSKNHKGTGTHYAKAVHYTGKDGEPVKFLASQKIGERIGKGEKGKTGYATVSGWVKSLDATAIRKYSDSLIKDSEWTQVGFDPRRQGSFYIRSGDNIGAAVTEATEVIQIGPLVLAKNVKVNKNYKGFSKGGKVLNSLRSKLNNV